MSGLPGIEERPRNDWLILMRDTPLSHLRNAEQIIQLLIDDPPSPAMIVEDLGAVLNRVRKARLQLEGETDE